jgi:hypothetical protein
VKELSSLSRSHARAHWVLLLLLLLLNSTTLHTKQQQ